MKLYLSNVISRIFGKFANYSFPYKIQLFINKAYVKIFKIDMSEFEDIKSYKSLNKLFTRKLKKNRFLQDGFISPSDSKISAIGDIKEDIAFQIKGMYYSIDELLQNFSHSEKEILKNGKFITFYLSPKDYHRYHAPIDMKITKTVHIPGLLLPVNKTSLLKNCNLFIKNERVICKCEDKNQNIFYLVFVGALNVGKIIIEKLPEISTNTAGMNKIYEQEIEFKKGEELGRFEMGSTIVALFPQNFLEFTTKLDDSVRFGEKIARLL